MMRRILLFFVVSWLYLTISAQVNEEGMAAYINDVKVYEQAINKIVKEHRYDEGISLLTTLIECSEKKVDYPLKDLASYYSARGQGELKKEQYQLAVNDGEKALELLRRAGETGRADLCALWYQQAIVFYRWGKTSETMMAADSCVKATLEYYGPYHSETMEAYSLRSNVAGFYNAKEKALDDRKQIFRIIQHTIERDFVYLTAAERSSYWNRYLPKTTHMFAFAHKMDEHESAFTDALFDQQLLAKGLLLSAESALQRAIDNDSDMRKTYQNIRRLRQKASDVKTLSKDAESATLEADRLERQLSTSANTLHQFLDFLKIHVDDVRGRLQPTDVAIEFVDYRVGKDSTMYAALVLSPQWPHAKFLPLLEEKELVAHSDNLYTHIWQPIIDLLGFKPTNIYFSPSGLLYRLPIESHEFADYRSFSEMYNVFRLSSTRWIAYSGDTEEGKDAVLYGGLDYDGNIDPTSQRLRGAVQDEYPYLPGTKTEAESIARTIHENVGSSLHVETLLGRKGTETSFKSLNGQFKRIIHIATHGFYKEAGTSERQSLNTPLDNSGLLFAGANDRLQGQLPQADADDGILTAYEISQLDLRGLELTALSACETGQGHITVDGVFGLQRGFKKAGAQSILMSLWKVDDEATCLLMTEFYKNWIGKKMTKHDALEKAKQTVRSYKDKGWDNPKYWAAFILLDALD